ncbi:hypothetical protein AAMO2058_001501300 [Amorphochlora amoebiformis]
MHADEHEVNHISDNDFIRGDGAKIIHGQEKYQRNEYGTLSYINIKTDATYEGFKIIGEILLRFRIAADGTTIEHLFCASLRVNIDYDKGIIQLPIVFICQPHRFRPSGFPDTGTISQAIAEEMI